MFICKYCGVHYQTFPSICPACGAPIQMKAEDTTEKARIDKIRRVCERHLNTEFKDGECISDKRMDTLRKSFRVFPEGKEILLYCDTTPLRTGKRGFLICEDGVYWQNTWTTPTTHNFINWDTFKRRKISQTKFDLAFDKGDVIDLSGLGGKDLRDLTLKLFKQIQDVLTESSQEYSK